jgi:hypothetical protein
MEQPAAAEILAMGNRTLTGQEHLQPGHPGHPSLAAQVGMRVAPLPVDAGTSETQE